MTDRPNPMDQHPPVSHKPDNEMPENSQANLDRKLDHAVKETFPTSDPVSVTITKGGAIDYDKSGNPISPGSKATSRTATREAEALLTRVKSAASDAADQVSAVARETYSQGKDYARATGERYPEAERYFREGTQAARQQAVEYPVLTLVVGIGIGYLLARVIHSARSVQSVPDYARTDRAYRR